MRQAVNDPYPLVQADALAGLAALGDPAAGELARTWLLHYNSGLRAAAIDALGILKAQDCVEPLIAMLTDPNGSVRCSAARALGEIGDPRAVAPLLELLKYEYAPAIRTEVVTALGQFDNPQVTDTLLAMLPEDETWQVQYKIFRALSARHDPRVIPPLIERMSLRAIDLLGEIGEPAYEPLMGLLNKPDPVLRSYAAKALGLIGDRRAAPALIAELAKDNTGYEGMQWNIEKALGQLKAQQAVDPLLALLAKHPSPTECSTLIEALGEIGDPQAEAAILPFLPDDDCRLAAVIALGKLRSRRAVEPLQAMLKTEEDHEVRAAIEKALAMIKEEAN